MQLTLINDGKEVIYIMLYRINRLSSQLIELDGVRSIAEIHSRRAPFNSIAFCPYIKVLHELLNTTHV